MRAFAKLNYLSSKLTTTL